MHKKNKLNRLILYSLLFLLSFAIFQNASYASTTASALLFGNFIATTPSPNFLHTMEGYPSCVLSSYINSSDIRYVRIYCMSAPTTQYGQGLYNYTNVTYFAPLSQNGIGTWTRTENYPINATDMGCTQLYETIYCVGGFITNKTSNSTYNINNTFYAHINPNGSLLWNKGPDYPIKVNSPGCVASSFNEIFCIGGGNTNESYYANINGSGIGEWHQFPSYPMPPSNRFWSGPSCFISNYSYIVCVGENYSANNPNDSIKSFTIKYGPGINNLTWIKSANIQVNSTPYGIIPKACTTYYYRNRNVTIFGICSEDYGLYATNLNSTMPKSWYKASSSTLPLAQAECMANATYDSIYCLGINTNYTNLSINDTETAYYVSPINSISSTSTTTSTSTTIPTSSTTSSTTSTSTSTTTSTTPTSTTTSTASTTTIPNTYSITFKELGIPKNAQYDTWGVFLSNTVNPSLGELATSNTVYTENPTITISNLSNGQYYYENEYYPSYTAFEGSVYIDNYTPTIYLKYYNESNFTGPIIKRAVLAESNPNMSFHISSPENILFLFSGDEEVIANQSIEINGASRNFSYYVVVPNPFKNDDAFAGAYLMQNAAPGNYTAKVVASSIYNTAPMQFTAILLPIGSSIAFNSSTGFNHTTVKMPQASLPYIYAFVGAGAGFLNVTGTPIGGIVTTNGYADQSYQAFSNSSEANVTNFLQGHPGNTAGILGIAITKPSLKSDYAVNITIANTQNVPTTAPFDQELIINSSKYSVYSAGNLDNIAFFYKNGTEIPSWLESGVLSNSEQINSNSNSNQLNESINTTYWLKLEKPIAAESNTIIYMAFFNKSLNLFNGYDDGEAPQLSPTYGQYDNGKYVFENYTGNKTTVSALDGSNPYRVIGWPVPGNAITEMYLASENTDNGQIMLMVASSNRSLTSGVTGTYTNMPYYEPFSVGYQNGSGLEIESNNGGTPYVATQSTIQDVPGLIGVYGSNLTVDYKVATTISGNVLGNGILATEANAGSVGSANFTFYYIRQREIPPNGVMPSTISGSIYLYKNLSYNISQIKPVSSTTTSTTSTTSTSTTTTSTSTTSTTTTTTSSTTSTIIQYTDINVGSGVDALALDSCNGDIYAANYNTSTVYVINGTSYIANISVGKGPRAILVDKQNCDVYVSDYGSSEVSVINENTLISNIKVGPNPISLALDNSTGVLYITDYGSNNVTEINTADNSVIGSTVVGSEPIYALYNPIKKLIYVADFGANNVSLINGTNETAIVHVGSEPDYEAYNTTGCVYVANYGSATVSVICGPPFNVTKTITNSTPPTPGSGGTVNGFGGGGGIYSSGGVTGNYGTICTSSSCYQVTNTGLISYNLTFTVNATTHRCSNSTYFVIIGIRTIAIPSNSTYLPYSFTAVMNNTQIQGIISSVEGQLEAEGVEPATLKLENGTRLYNISYLANVAPYQTINVEDVALLSDIISLPSELSGVLGNVAAFGLGYGITLSAVSESESEILGLPSPPVIVTQIADELITTTSYEVEAQILDNPSILKYVGNSTTPFNVSVSFGSGQKLLIEIPVKVPTSEIGNSISASIPISAEVPSSDMDGPAYGDGAFTLSQSAQGVGISLTSIPQRISNVTFSFKNQPIPKPTITFEEQGLPQNTTWGVSVNGTEKQSNSSTISYTLEQGNYSFTIGNVKGYTVSLSNGTIDAMCVNETITVQYKPIDYNVTFTTNATILSEWGISLSNGESASSSSNQITFSLPDGYYTFNAIPPEGYSGINSSFVVNSSNKTIPVNFRKNPPSVPSYGAYATIPVGKEPVAEAFDSNNCLLYVANFGSNSVSVIDGIHNIANVSVGTEPDDLAIDTQNGFVYVSDYGSSSVSIIDGTTLIATLPVISNPTSIMYDSEADLVYVYSDTTGKFELISGSGIVGSGSEASYLVPPASASLSYDPCTGDAYSVNSTTGKIILLKPDQFPPNVSISNSSTTYGLPDSISATSESNGTIRLSISSISVEGNNSVEYNICTTDSCLAAGSYIVRACNVDNGLCSANYTLKIGKASPEISLALNVSNTVYGNSVNATASISTVGNQLSGTLYLDGINVSSTNSRTLYKSGILGFGTHNYTFATPGNENYTAEEASKSFNVSKASPKLYLSINITKPGFPGPARQGPIGSGKPPKGPSVMQINYGISNVINTGIGIPNNVIADLYINNTVVANIIANGNSTYNVTMPELASIYGLAFNPQNITVRLYTAGSYNYTNSSTSNTISLVPVPPGPHPFIGPAPGAPAPQAHNGLSNYISISSPSIQPDAQGGLNLSFYIEPSQSLESNIYGAVLLNSSQLHSLLSSIMLQLSKQGYIVPGENSYAVVEMPYVTNGQLCGPGPAGTQNLVSALITASKLLSSLTGSSLDIPTLGLQFNGTVLSISAVSSGYSSLESSVGSVCSASQSVIDNGFEGMGGIAQDSFCISGSSCSYPNYAPSLYISPSSQVYVRIIGIVPNESARSAPLSIKISSSDFSYSNVSYYCGTDGLQDCQVLNISNSSVNANFGPVPIPINTLTFNEEGLKAPCVGFLGLCFNKIPLIGGIFGPGNLPTWHVMLMLPNQTITESSNSNSLQFSIPTNDKAIRWEYYAEAPNGYKTENNSVGYIMFDGKPESVNVIFNKS